MMSCPDKTFFRFLKEVCPFFCGIAPIYSKPHFSAKGSWAWKTDTAFLPTEYEVFGAPIWSETGSGGGFQCQFPIYQQSSEYLVRCYNGSRQIYWIASPYAGNAPYNGDASNNTAGSVYGCAPDSARITCVGLFKKPIIPTQKENRSCCYNSKYQL
jgi:hypothetical protein